MMFFGFVLDIICAWIERNHLDGSSVGSAYGEIYDTIAAHFPILQRHIAICCFVSGLKVFKCRTCSGVMVLRSQH